MSTPMIDPKILDKYPQLKKAGPPVMGLIPDIYQNLPFIRKGWKYEIESIGSLADTLTGTSRSGGTINLTKSQHPFKFKESNAPGWVLSITCAFDNPFGSMYLKIDDWEFNVSPYTMTLMSGDLVDVGPGNWIVGVASWVHMTPYGPLYGLILDPAEPLPMTSDLTLAFTNGSGGLKTNIELMLASIGRIYIPRDDHDDFLTSMREWKLEQMYAKQPKRRT